MASTKKAPKESYEAVVNRAEYWQKRAQEWKDKYDAAVTKLNDEIPIGRIAWWRIERLDPLEENHRVCEAPRHLGLNYPAVYVMACVPGDSEDFVQGMCAVCMEIIARDLGTTVEEGAI